MKECSVKMETTVSEIQVENKDEKTAAEVSPQDERQEEKGSTLCFKRRKKAAKALKPKAGSEATDEARAFDQPQPLGGAWASFKRLVTRRKRSDSSKEQKRFEAKVQPEINAEDAGLSKKKSRLKIPCIKFSRSEKRSSHSKIIEDSDCSIQVQGEAGSLDTKTQTQLTDQTTKARSIQDLRKGVSQTPEIGEANVSNSITSPAEKVVSVELGLVTGHSAIQTETLILEKHIETIQEKQGVQHEQANPPETSETDHQLPVVSDVPLPPAIPDQQIVEEASNSILEGGPNWKGHESREIVAKESKRKDTEVCTGESDTKENEISVEKPKSEESKRMEPIAIIITDTEISEFDMEKSKNVPKQFLISIENEQVGVFANDSGFEGRTSEYETLLIETASSLVKNAIQLSIEQLVNEMVSDDNKINNLLQ
ncbi:A-kinase anchor protein 5 [Trichechus manatus latirostris]|uniref:A-kinase anchor protein 5 n=1 Tax=Trichechus manatus latirostris TaxID=127582 RepID=A0A2Y9DBK0_TRIMA|nr:A-kinase anchor protein 5 [Trichechus manatus latirostris]XP_023582043.1 A-kinase anchor protein 5 [Trichechus manatus latirostris]